MKRILILVVTVLLISSFTGCAKNDMDSKNEHAEVPAAKQTDSKVLVAYFSNTGTTKGVAEMIAEETQGTLYEIRPKNAYTTEDLDYQNSDSRASREQADATARPGIQGDVKNMAEYDVIFLGYPIWWGDAPKIIQTFLESYDFSHKRLIPFCTSGSSDIGTSADVLKSLTQQASWLTGRRFSKETSRHDIQPWISAFDLSKPVQDEPTVDKMYLKISDHVLETDLVDHSSTQALLDLLHEQDITIAMHDYSHFEKVGEIGASLPRNDEQIAVKAGDLILYEGTQFSIYYDENTWNFTKLGTLTSISQSELKALLGEGDVSVTLSLTRE